VKHKLYVTDHLENRINERATQFILSLASHVNINLIELDEIFIDDKIGYEYYAIRQAQLNKSIKLSHESGQLELYENLYLPANKVIKGSSTLPLDQIAVNMLNDEIDELVLEIKTLVAGQFHPCNPSDMAKLNSAQDSPIKKEVLSLALLVQDLDAKRPYVPPEGFKLNSIPIPTWTPNKLKMQEETLSEGYFTGPLSQRFYVSPVNQAEAKLALSRAELSLLLAYQVIIDNNLKSAYINQHYKEVVYLEPKQEQPTILV